MPHDIETICNSGRQGEIKTQNGGMSAQLEKSHSERQARKKEKQREADRRWYWRHRPQKLLAIKKWRKSHTLERRQYRERKREHIKQRSKIYAKINRVRIALYEASRREAKINYLKLYRYKNKEQLAIKRRAIYQIHREKIIADNKLYRKLHPEVARRWHKAHPEFAAKKNHRRRNAPTTSDSGRAIDKIHQRKITICFYCGKKCKPTIEHIIPLAKGGCHSAANIVAACAKCNFGKGARLPNDFIQRGQLVLL